MLERPTCIETYLGTPLGTSLHYIVGSTIVANKSNNAQ